MALVLKLMRLKNYMHIY